MLKERNYLKKKFNKKLAISMKIKISETLNENNIYNTIQSTNM